MNREIAIKKFKRLRKAFHELQALQNELSEKFPIFDEDENAMAVLSYPYDFPDSAFTNVIDHGVIYDFEVPIK